MTYNVSNGSLNRTISILSTSLPVMCSDGECW